MRVCLLTTCFPRHAGDDAGIFVGRLVAALAGLGLSGLVITPHDGSEATASEKPGAFQIIRYRYGIFSRGRLAFGAGIMPNLRKNPLLVLQAPALLAQMVMKALAARREYEVIHANWMASGLAAWFVHLLTGKPYVITLRGEDLKLVEKKILRLFFRPALRRAAHITTVNEAFAAKVKELYGIGNERIKFIPNGVDLPTVESDSEKFAARHGLSPERKYLTFVGRIIPLKRLEVLIQALHDQRLADFELLLCGPALDSKYLEQLQSQISSLGLKRRVHLPGRLAPEEVFSALALSRYYVSASSYEGRSNSILEAMLARKIVFASNICGHAELIKQGETGFLFDGSSDLAALILQAEDDPVLQCKVRENAFNMLSSNSWETCARRYKETFEKSPE